MKNLESILSNNMIRLQKEDVLFGFVNDLYNQSEKYSVLFQYIHFEYVSYSLLKQFFDPKLNLELINQNIWKSICSLVSSRVVNNFQVNSQPILNKVQVYIKDLPTIVDNNGISTTLITQDFLSSLLKNRADSIMVGKKTGKNGKVKLFAYATFNSIKIAKV